MRRGERTREGSLLVKAGIHNRRPRGHWGGGKGNVEGYEKGTTV